MKGAKNLPLTNHEKERQKEIKNIIDTIKPHITAFSYTIQKSSKQKDEVTCGGKVKYIVDTGMLIDDQRQRIIFVTIDDTLGELLVVVPPVFWDQLDIVVGDIIITTGVVFRPEKVCDFVSEANTTITVKQDDDPFRILVKSIRKVSS
jgi:hypothetical protein